MCMLTVIGSKTLCYLMPSRGNYKHLCAICPKPDAGVVPE